MLHDLKQDLCTLFLEYTVGSPLMIPRDLLAVFLRHKSLKAHPDPMLLQRKMISRCLAERKTSSLSGGFTRVLDIEIE